MDDSSIHSTGEMLHDALVHVVYSHKTLPPTNLEVQKGPFQEEGQTHEGRVLG